jgi:hypothetical protein
LNGLQKGVLKDKAWLEMFAVVSKGLSPYSNIISEYSNYCREGLELL